MMPMRQQAAQAQPTPWKSAPPLAHQAAGVQTQPVPVRTRGVSAEAPAKFVLPSPQALGVTVSLHSPAVKAPIDWNLIQSRLERLGVLRYEKNILSADGVRVVLLLPTSDPAQGQPVTAHAATEAAAIVMALDAAEAWARKR